MALGIAKRVTQAMVIAAARMASEEPPDDTPAVAPEQTPIATHSEAPASVNVRLTLYGRDVQLTLRDSDEVHLLTRLEALLQRFPVAETPASVQTLTKGWCPKHSVQMKEYSNAKGTWQNYKTPEGWCNGK